MYLGEVCFVFFFVLMLYFIRMGKQEKQTERKIEGMNGCYRFFYPGVFFLLDKLRKRFSWRLKGDRLERLRRVYTGKGEEEIFFIYYGKMTCVLTGAFLLSLLFVTFSGMITQKGKLLDKYFLEKDSVLGEEKTVHLTAKLKGQEKEVSISVPQKYYTEKQLRKKWKEAKRFVNQEYLGENASEDEISKPLNLLTSVPGNAVTISWKLDIDGIIQEDGSIANEELEEKCPVEITAVLSYGNQEKYMTKMLTVLPPKKAEEEQYWENWQRQLEENQEESRTETYLKLPDSVNGKKVSYTEKKIPVMPMILGASLFFMVMLVLLQEEKIRKEMKYREKELGMDYPEFVEHFVLLIGAGLNVKGAWERIVKDYERESKGKHYVYEEMRVSVREMENGMGEARAYELFGKRTGLLQYMKFCTLLVQNLKKGSDDLLSLLDYEVAEAFRERKENARALGEEAGTKLLFPMMLMLVIVFALILYAAFYNM